MNHHKDSVKILLRIQRLGNHYKFLVVDGLKIVMHDSSHGVKMCLSAMWLIISRVPCLS